MNNRQRMKNAKTVKKTLGTVGDAIPSLTPYSFEKSRVIAYGRVTASPIGTARNINVYMILVAMTTN